METYQKALTLAWEKLAARRAEIVAKAAGVEYKERKFQTPFLGKIYAVETDKQRILLESAPVNGYLSVLFLHYLVGAKDIPLSGKLISFKDSPEGSFYYPAYYKRSLLPLIKTFGEHPEALFAAGKSLGAEKISMGDAGIRIKVFPKLPLSLIIWRGDKELPPAANILFDASATRMLPAEDLSTAAGMTTNCLVKNKK